MLVTRSRKAKFKNFMNIFWKMKYQMRFWAKHDYSIGIEVWCLDKKWNRQCLEDNYDERIGTEQYLKKIQAIFEITVEILWLKKDRLIKKQRQTKIIAEKRESETKSSWIDGGDKKYTKEFIVY
jgi:hypothetical protein